MTVSVAVTLLKKFGLEAVAVIVPCGLLTDVTLTVRVTESVVPAAMLVVRVQLGVLSVQIHPPVASVHPVGVRPGGSVMVRITEL